MEERGSAQKNSPWNFSSGEVLQFSLFGVLVAVTIREALVSRVLSDETRNKTRVSSYLVSFRLLAA